MIEKLSSSYLCHTQTERPHSTFTSPQRRQAKRRRNAEGETGGGLGGMKSATKGSRWKLRWKKHLDGTNLRPRSRKRYSSKQTGEPCHQNFRVLGEQTALTIRLNNHSKRQSVAPLGDRTQAIAQGGISSALQTPFTEASW